MIDYLLLMNFEMYIASFIACLIIREGMILLLPDEIAGPGGSFIDTGPE